MKQQTQIKDRNDLPEDVSFSNTDKRYSKDRFQWEYMIYKRMTLLAIIFHIIIPLIFSLDMSNSPLRELPQVSIFGIYTSVRIIVNLLIPFSLMVTISAIRFKKINPEHQLWWFICDLCLWFIICYIVDIISSYLIYSAYGKIF